METGSLILHEVEDPLQDNWPVGPIVPSLEGTKQAPSAPSKASNRRSPSTWLTMLMVHCSDVLTRSTAKRPRSVKEEEGDEFKKYIFMVKAMFWSCSLLGWMICEPKESRGREMIEDVSACREGFHLTNALA